MDQKRVCLTVPAEPGFARIVRMTAASLAVTCDMGVDEVEDARMAAEDERFSAAFNEAMSE